MDSTAQAIDACIEGLTYLAKSKYVADELRGAVWEFFLTNPQEPCDSKNLNLRRFIVKSLQLAASFTDVSDIQVGPSGDEYSLVDITAHNEDTPESLLSEAQDPTPDPEKPDISQALANALALLTWREELMFKMQAEGMSCEAIGHYLGITQASVHTFMSIARRKVMEPPQVPNIAYVPTPRLRLAPLCLRRG